MFFILLSIKLEPAVWLTVNLSWLKKLWLYISSLANCVEEKLSYMHSSVVGSCARLMPFQLIPVILGL